MATITETINELYPYAALFIYANNKEITKERILSVIKILGFEGQSKLAELFACDVIKMKGMLSSVSSVSAPAPSVATQDAGSEVKEEVKEEEPIEEIALDFGDLF